MSLSSIFQDIADAIRSKTGKADSIYPSDMASEIEGISSGGGYKLEKMPSGAVSSFNDGTDLPLNKLKVSIEPVQDLHGYNVPWVGGAGKNKLNNIASSITKNNVTFTVNSDGSVKVYSTGATAAVILVLTNENNPLIIQANKSYIMSGCPNGGSNSTYELMLIATPTSGGKALVHDYGNGVTIESIESDRILGVQIVVRRGQVINDTFYPMIRLATETDATFAPYSNICPISGYTEANVVVSSTTDAEDGHTYTIDLDGTRYGGTLDVVSGVLTVDRAYVDMGTLNWANAGMSTTAPTGHHAYTYINLGAKYSGSDDTISNLICSQYVAVSRNDTYRGTAEGFSINANGDLFAYISDYATDTASAFKTAMNGVQLVYELATPITYQLTPTAVRSLIELNNIWADTGDIINGEYFKGVESSGSDGIITRNIRSGTRVASSLSLTANVYESEV